MSTAPCKDIFVVEDDDGIRETLKLALEMEGYTVNTAANGLEGLELLPHLSTPCLILLDLMMPVMDGWAFAAALRADRMLAPIPVVVVTAFGERAACVTQARGVLRKPIDFDSLLRLVKQFCH